MAKYKCDNCDFQTENIDDITPLSVCKDLALRLDVGGVVPAGECPECECLVYIKEEPSTALLNFVRAVEDTGGIGFDHKAVPYCAADAEWTDLAAIYLEACKELGREPKMAEPDDDESEGDDLCDQCMRSGVAVARTNAKGETICTDCDALS